VKSSRLIALRLSGYGCAYFFAAGAFVSYWPEWLRDRGVDDIGIGTLFMIRQLALVPATLAVGWVAHKAGDLRAVLVVLAVATFVLSASYGISYSFDAILLITLLWGIVWSPTLALYDRVLVVEAAMRGFHYSSLRLWGSVSYILGTLVCGVAVYYWGPHWILYVVLAGTAVMVLMGLCIPDPAPQPFVDHAPFGMLDLFASRPFLLFLVATSFCIGSHAMLYSLSTLIWRDAGINEVTISLLWGEAVGAEILLMMAGDWLLKRAGVCGMIGLGLACGVIRWTGMAFTTELWALLLLQTLHAGTFAACHIGAMSFIQRAIPHSGVALAQTTYYAIGAGAVTALLFELSGDLYTGFGQHAFLGMAAVSGAGMLALLVLARTWDGAIVFGRPATDASAS
jgi:PPP family 3-phenylpropionic acid transporter